LHLSLISGVYFVFLCINGGVSSSIFDDAEVSILCYGVRILCDGVSDDLLPINGYTIFIIDMSVLLREPFASDVSSISGLNLGGSLCINDFD
jgi:hypothetical protein